MTSFSPVADHRDKELKKTKSFLRPILSGTFEQLHTHDDIYCFQCKKMTSINYTHCDICETCHYFYEDEENHCCKICKTQHYSTPTGEEEKCDKCGICKKTFSKHCDKCNKCVPGAYIHCDQCNECYSTDEYQSLHRDCKSKRYCEDCKKYVNRGYTHCKYCQKCVPSHFNHCHKCISKEHLNGTCVEPRHYHCDACEMCVYFLLKHCDGCNICVDPRRHIYIKKYNACVDARLYDAEGRRIAIQKDEHGLFK